MLDLSKDAIKALSGRDLATLKADERAVFDFFAAQGRKHGIAISFMSDAPEEEILQVSGEDQFYEVISRYPSTILVTEEK